MDYGLALDSDSFLRYWVPSNAEWDDKLLIGKTRTIGVEIIPEIGITKITLRHMNIKDIKQMRK